MVEMKRFKNVLFVLDPRENCRAALERAVGLVENNQANLTVVDVVPRIAAGFILPEGGAVPADLQVALVEEHARRLEILTAPFRDRIRIASKVLTGTPFLEVIREVQRSGHDLLIRSPEDPGWRQRIFGSDDMHLLRKCPCPVWLIQCQAPKAYRRILAAVDAGDGYPADELATRQAMNFEIIELAGALALSEFAELHVAHVWEAVGESFLRGAFLNTPSEKVDAYVEATRQRHAANLDALMGEAARILGQEAFDYLKPRTHLVRGGPRREIPALAERLGIDLVVMGTVARTGIPGFIMGNTAESILEQIGCSVLAIKPSGFVSPVALTD
jgi:nucleotide-binding universal stress UspA family protein